MQRGTPNRLAIAPSSYNQQKNVQKIDVKIQVEGIILAYTVENSLYFSAKKKVLQNNEPFMSY